MNDLALIKKHSLQIIHQYCRMPSWFKLHCQEPYDSDGLDKGLKYIEEKLFVFDGISSLIEIRFSGILRKVGKNPIMLRCGLYSLEGLGLMPNGNTHEMCLRQLLAPVARYCLRHSVRLRNVIQIYKQCLLEAAQHQLETEGVEVSNSRLSVMTGVHRKDVASYFTSEKQITSAPDIVTKIIGQWQSDKRFCDKSRKPRVLSFETAQSEFAALVHTVSQDLNPYTILFELERILAVEKTSAGLKLKKLVHKPKGDVVQGLQLLAKDVSDLIAAVEENLYEEPAIPNLHIKTEYDNIPSAAVEEIRDWLLSEGEIFQERIRERLSQYDRDINPDIDDDSSPARIAFGTFSRVDDSKSQSNK